MTAVRFVQMIAADSHILAPNNLVGVNARSYKQTPCAGDFNKLSKDDEKMDESRWLDYRSCVGKLLYLAPDRPDIQYVVPGLAAFLKEPTLKAWKALQHLFLNLKGSTYYEGVALMKVDKGTSVLNVDNFQSEERGTRPHLMEIICSISSVKIYLDGHLMESYMSVARRVLHYLQASQSMSAWLEDAQKDCF